MKDQIQKIPLPEPKMMIRDLKTGDTVNYYTRDQLIDHGDSMWVEGYKLGVLSGIAEQLGG